MENLVDLSRFPSIPAAFVRSAFVHLALPGRTASFRLVSSEVWSISQPLHKHEIDDNRVIVSNSLAADMCDAKQRILSLGIIHTVPYAAYFHNFAVGLSKTPDDHKSAVAQILGIDSDGRPFLLFRVGIGRVD